jgi:hypothetical protein
MPRYFMSLNTRPICAQYGNHFPFAFSRRYVGGKSGPCRAVISARVLDRSRRRFVLVPRGSRVPLPIEVLQPSIDRLARTFQLRSDLARCHSGIKHVSKLLFFRWRPAAPDTFRSRHFPFAFGPSLEFVSLSMSRTTRESSSATFGIHAVQYVAPAFPNHPQNKCETQNKKQNRKDIEDHSKPRCNMFEPFASFHQPDDRETAPTEGPRLRS